MMVVVMMRGRVECAPVDSVDGRGELEVCGVRRAGGRR